MPTKPDPAPTERTQLGEEIVDDLRSVVQKLRRLEGKLGETEQKLTDALAEVSQLVSERDEARDYASWAGWLEDFVRDVITREELLERTIGRRD